MNQHRPLAGRRLYFVGIGGSGLSAYANIARAWGADVRGWDAQETIFTETLEGIEIDLGGDPAPPEGFEAVVSTAHLARCDGTPRAAFLAELVAAQPSIVVPDVDVDRVPVLVDELLAAPERLAAMREAMLSLARPEAADVIADELVALAQGRGASVR